MKLFNKTKIRFETITIERRNDVFRALENRGWTLVTDPYQIEMDRTPEKLRKIAMKNAKELNGELVVETWDPIHIRQPYKGLTYSVWRQMTPAEIQQKKLERERERSGRPDYSDTMGSLEDLSRKILQRPQVNIPTDDMQALDEMAKDTQYTNDAGMVYGNKDEDMKMVRGGIETRSTENPYDHQGESDSDIIRADRSSPPGTEEGVKNLPGVASADGPVFDNSMKLDLNAEYMEEEEVQDLDPLAMMMAAADEVPSRQETPDEQVPAPPPAAAQGSARTDSSSGTREARRDEEGQ